MQRIAKSPLASLLSGGGANGQCLADRVTGLAIVLYRYNPKRGVAASSHPTTDRRPPYMLVLQAFALSGLFYAGSRLFSARRQAAAAPGHSAKARRQAVLGPAPAPVEDPHADAQAQAGRELRASSAALGLALGGAALGAPLLGLASVPVLLLARAPCYAAAWRALRARRVDASVLDATRVSVCVVMGYATVAALDAWLHAHSQRLFAKSAADLRDSLRQSLALDRRAGWVECAGVELHTPLDQIKPGMVLALRTGDWTPAAGVVLSGLAEVAPRHARNAADGAKPGDHIAAGVEILSGSLAVRVEAAPSTADDLPAQLQAAPQAQTPLRWLGEYLGGQMAPLMLAGFALSIPLLGVNRAAAFLTVRFGAQMRDLSPYAARQIIGAAAACGLLVCAPRALEWANRVNTVVFDARVLADPAARPHGAALIQALRQRDWRGGNALAQPFTVFAMTDSEGEGQRLEEKMGLDGYFVEPDSAGRAALLTRLQQGGRLVCYVGAAGHDAEAMQAAPLSVDVRPASDLSATQAHIVLQDPRLRGLPGVFDLGRWFADRQQLNLLAPVGADLLKFSAALFPRSGLLYSVLLSYGGLMAGAAHASLPKPAARP
ncbi:MAG: hypothetical protein ACKN9T_15025 [Candidatus Methylumidiphilus sp.]